MWILKTLWLIVAELEALYLKTLLYICVYLTTAWLFLFSPFFWHKELRVQAWFRLEAALLKSIPFEMITHLVKNLMKLWLPVYNEVWNLSHLPCNHILLALDMQQSADIVRVGFYLLHPRSDSTLLITVGESMQCVLIWLFYLLSSDL